MPFKGGEMPEADYSKEEYILTLELIGLVIEPAIRQAIRTLAVEHGRGLDVPCGIGSHSVWMVDEYPDLRVEGVDCEPAHIEYAKKLAAENGMTDQLSFFEGDMNRLQYSDDSFDFIWCCNGLWPGATEFGCIIEQPYDILNDFKRIVKPRGKIAILYWTGQKILPGYPLLESALNACLSANIPMTFDTPPELHIMNTVSWLRKTGFSNIKSKTFAVDIIGPIGPEIRKAFHGLSNKLWATAEEELSPELLKTYREITDPSSNLYIFNEPDYTGFLTYTMFSAIVPG